MFSNESNQDKQADFSSSSISIACPQEEYINNEVVRRDRKAKRLHNHQNCQNNHCNS